MHSRIGVIGALALALTIQIFPLASVDAATSTSSGSLSGRGTATVPFDSQPGSVIATLSCTGRTKVTMTATDPAGQVVGKTSVNCRVGGRLSFEASIAGSHTLVLSEERGLGTTYSLTVETPDALTVETPDAPTASSPTTTAPPSTLPSTAAPGSPPVRVCDNPALLDGPSSPPAGSVRVDPGQDLNAATQSSAAGTTFWLAPGVHTLGTSEFGQVVPKDGNTYVGAPGAILDGRSVNRYAFTQKAADVTIKHLTVRNFMAPGDEAVVNHDMGAGWVIERNTIAFNGGAGVYLGDDNDLRYNCLADNSQYGFQANGADIVVTHNEVARNNTYDWETKSPGCGCSGGSKFWTAGPGIVSHNWVHDNANVGLWWDNNNVGFLIEGNYIADNFGHGIEYETSYNFRIANNTLKRNALGIGKKFAARNDPFPVGAIYLSEAGGEPRLNGGTYGLSEVVGNVFEDNWGGVVLWENADRFGNDGSANTSKGHTTLVIEQQTGTAGVWPNTVGMGQCDADSINDTPDRKWDCRWRTQNIRVADNVFSLNKAAISCTTTLCGQQAIFSNSGTMPSWSPYKGSIIQDAITYRQNNKFSNNHYTGDWRFVAYQATGATMTLSQWQAAPYNQDSGSTS